MNIIIIAFAIAALIVSLSIETTSWWVKSLAQSHDIGHHISKTNIYLYGGRFFALVFSVALAFLVDLKETTWTICLIVGSGFILSALFHLFIVRFPAKTGNILLFFLKPLKLKTRQFPSGRHKSDMANTVLWCTCLASAFFAFGLGLPFILASIFPEFRMTINNIGQLFNSIGTLALLFFVDQKLFEALDNGDLGYQVHQYSVGRSIGFGASGLLFLSAGLFSTSMLAK